MQNVNKVFDGYVSVSCRGASNKEVSLPEYHIQDHNIRYGVLDSVKYAVLQWWFASVVTYCRLHVDGLKGVICAIIK